VAVLATLIGPRLKRGPLEPEADKAIAAPTSPTRAPIIGHSRRRRRIVAARPRASRRLGRLNP
jgi:hypothetical protein